MTATDPRFLSERGNLRGRAEGSCVPLRLVLEVNIGIFQRPLRPPQEVLNTFEMGVRMAAVLAELNADVDARTTVRPLRRGSSSERERNHERRNQCLKVHYELLSVTIVAKPQAMSIHDHDDRLFDLLFAFVRATASRRNLSIALRSNEFFNACLEFVFLGICPPNLFRHFPRQNLHKS